MAARHKRRGSRRRLSFLPWAAAVCCASAALPRAGAVQVQSGATGLGGEDPTFSRYLIASFPALRRVNYVRLADPVWRPLVAELKRPEAVAVDAENKRLFVADSSLDRVYWYRLFLLPDKRLITDDQQHEAVPPVAARSLALDSVGTLFLAGRMAQPPEEPEDAIYKQDAIELATAVRTGIPRHPRKIWTRTNTAQAGTSTSSLLEPSSVVTDPFHVIWGNVRSSPESGAVLMATLDVPALNPGSKVKKMADNVEGVSCLTSTSTDIFYADRKGIYGVALGKEEAGCGPNDVYCPKVAEADDPRAMVWDGDSTIYVAVHGSGVKGGVFSFASGSTTPHELEKVISARDIGGLALLDIADSGGSRPGVSFTGSGLLVTAALLFAAAGPSRPFQL